jgi:hypothetical protein
MLGRVAPVRTDVSGELSVSINRVTRIGKLGTLAVTSVVRFSVFTAVTKNGGDMFLRNVGSYQESHDVFIPQKRRFLNKAWLFA